jgi:hypothetical protein
MTEEGLLDQAREIEQLANQVQVVIAGPGATPEVAQQTHTHPLDHDPVSAAAIIDCDHPPPRDGRRRRLGTAARMFCSKGCDARPNPCAMG